MGDQCDIARGGEGSIDHALRSRRHRRAGLTVRAGIRPDRPAGDRFADDLRRDPFVVAVVPFVEISVDHRGIPEPEQFGGASSPLERAAEDEVEVVGVHDGSKASGHVLTLGKQWKVSGTGVPPVLRPFGRGVPEEPNLFRRIGHVRFPRESLRERNWNEVVGVQVPVGVGVEEFCGDTG